MYQYNEEQCEGNVRLNYKKDENELYFQNVIREEAFYVIFCVEKDIISLD